MGECFMVKYNLNGMLLLASALSFTACNDPVNGYFAPMQQDPGTGSTSSVGPTGASGTPSNPGGNSSGGSKSPCTPQMAQNLRVVLLVDASGSTTTTDPGAKIRLGSFLDFVNANLALTSLTYSVSYFANSSTNATYDFTAGKFTANSSASFGTAAQVPAAGSAFLTAFKNLSVQGTDYQVALQKINDLITADNAANPEKYNYAIIFMSDGQPNEDDQTATSLDSLVSSLVKIVGPNRATLSSVYFNNVQSSADENIIDSMATAGGGQYVNGSTANLNLNQMIESILTVPANACPPPKS
jgi:uncharacterized protein YegL